MKGDRRRIYRELLETRDWGKAMTVDEQLEILADEEGQIYWPDRARALKGFEAMFAGCVIS